jgi:hypothetical protein
MRSMISVRGRGPGGTACRASWLREAKEAPVARVHDYVRGFIGVALVVGWVGWVGCAAPSTDYTPQIHVAPGAAARSLWILSKNAKKAAEEANVDAGTDEQNSEQTDEQADAPTDEREAASAEGTGVPAAAVAKVLDSVRVADAGPTPR